MCIRFLAMLVLLSQTDFSCEILYTYLSFTLVTFYLTTLLYIVEKQEERGSSQVSSSTLAIQPQLQLLSQTATCVLRLFGKVTFNRLRFQYPWVAQGSVISTAYCYPLDFHVVCDLLGPKISTYSAIPVIFSLFGNSSQ